MPDESKPIDKTDVAAKELIIDVMDGRDSGGFDVDSIYHIDGRGWVVVEFLKCETVTPVNSHPNRYWWKNSQKFINLWNLATDLDGELVLVNYEENHEDFKVIKVKDLDEDDGIQDERIEKMSFEEFQEYFVALNEDARGI